MKINRNKLNVFLVTSLLFFMLPAVVQAETDQDEIMVVDQEEDLDEKILDKLTLEQINDFWGQISSEYGEFIPDVSNKNVADLIKDDDSISLKSSFTGMIKFLLHELIINGKLLGNLIILTLFSVILQSMHAAFEKSVVSKIAYFVVYIVLIYITLNSFYLVFTYAKETIETMSNFMIALLPLMLGLIATSGQIITVSFFHPVIIFLIHVSGILMTSFVFPLLYLSALLVIVSHLNEHFKATHLAELFKSVSLGTLGLFLTIFLGVMSVQGTATAIQDGVALKTTKFITGNFIPVVGRTFTDAADTVLTAAQLLKNAVGIVGLLIVVFIAVFPAIKIVAISLIYKLAAALLQPLGKSPIIVSLNIISKYILYVLACLITVTFMFFLSIVIITVASNIPLLLR
ncbi:stage III sporulation protein AE [Pseudogracilibacillus auburnensis]|uniref:Stage III sporulation protein AE n=1 Tax=Pseudogracilibacillus auburnensis TaxID=1494959 RepID=A0A2V3VYK2_9BACI|nr:stage III sporulation protein AE [Pseudogracilibacillus auburnensis]PXW85045.1 stage III sporulation protein AE [Pseudogracilibacillus auburnensis]